MLADDCVIYRVITSDKDVSILQSDINTISSWCKSWLMQLNNKKWKSVGVSRKPNTLNYIENMGSQSVSGYKYLGVHITNNLLWKTHIDFIVNNANRMFEYRRRNLLVAPTN